MADYMFLEVTKEVYNKRLKKALENLEIKYLEVDVLKDLMRKVPEEKKPKDVSYVHLEFPTLSIDDKKTINRIAKIVDECYGIIADESRQTPEINKPKAYETTFEIE